MRAQAVHQPVRIFLDANAVMCGEQGGLQLDSPWDDHLAEITVPVFYVGAAGGFGAPGIYNTTILGSTDVSHLVVSLLGEEEQMFDLGHSELFLADNAEQLFWQPILGWLEAHP